MSCEKPCSLCEPNWYAEASGKTRLAEHPGPWAYQASAGYKRAKIRLCTGCFQRVMGQTD